MIGKQKQSSFKWLLCLKIIHFALLATCVNILHVLSWVLILKPFNEKYCIDEIRNEYTTWTCMCENNEDVIRVYMQVKEPVIMWARWVDEVLNEGAK